MFKLDDTVTVMFEYGTQFGVGGAKDTDFDEGQFTGTVRWLPSNGAIHIEDEVFNVRIFSYNVIESDGEAHLITAPEVRKQFRVIDDKIHWLIDRLIANPALHEWQKRSMVELASPHEKAIAENLALYDYKRNQA